MSINVNGDVILNVHCHDDLIKTHAMRKATHIKSTCNNAVNMGGS